jgi:hypothetical protein
LQRLAEVHAVGEHLVDRAFGPSLAATFAVRASTPLRHLPTDIELPSDGERRARPGETIEDPAHECRLALDHHQPAVLNLVAERGPTSHPHAFAPTGGKLVADALADDLPFKLGEAEQNIER